MSAKALKKHTQTHDEDDLLPSEQQALQTFQNITLTVSKDSHGFLSAFINHALIPPNFETRPRDKQQQIIKAATIKLSMFEGYHSFDNPTPLPVWTRLPHEPKAYFQAFRQYLLSPNRSLHNSGNDLDFQPEIDTNQANKTNQIHSIKAAYYYFYWKERAKAYDLLRPIAAARLKDQRILIAEDTHYTLSNSILEQLTKEIQNRADDSAEDRPWAGLKASEIISALSTMIGIQRVSVGLPMSAPRPNTIPGTPLPNISVERGIQEQAQHYLSADDAAVTQAQKQQREIQQAIANDPDAAALLQQAALDVMMRARQSVKKQQEEDNKQQLLPPEPTPEKLKAKPAQKIIHKTRPKEE